MVARTTPPEQQPRPDGYDFDLITLRVRDSEGRVVFLHPNRVVRIRTFDKRTHIFTETGETYQGDRPMHDLLKAFPGQWIRVHRGLAVRPASIIMMKGRRVYLDNGENYPMSRRQFIHLYYRSESLWHLSKKSTKKCYDDWWNF